MQQFALILPILFPILSGLLLLCLPGFTKNKKINRESYAQKVANSGYDAKDSAKILEDLYIGE